jgi:hypothetical protein
MTTTNDHHSPPRVRLLGEYDHGDFDDAIKLLRGTAQIVDSPEVTAELYIVAQSRPDALSATLIQLLRRDAPLTRIVALLGTWCEGETRTGRPWPEVERIYWYEFPSWWRRQLAIRLDCGIHASLIEPPKSETRNRAQGLVALRTWVPDTAAVLSEVLQAAGYATAWRQPGRPAAVVRGAIAGIWDGSQLSDAEADDLASFCRLLARDRAPVVALLDFPRRDRCEVARKIGAATILGKPWLNVELLAAIEEVSGDLRSSDASPSTQAA